MKDLLIAIVLLLVLVAVFSRYETSREPIEAEADYVPPPQSGDQTVGDAAKVVQDGGNGAEPAASPETGYPYFLEVFL